MREYIKTSKQKSFSFPKIPMIQYYKITSCVENGKGIGVYILQRTGERYMKRLKEVMRQLRIFPTLALTSNYMDGEILNRYIKLWSAGLRVKRLRTSVRKLIALFELGNSVETYSQS